MFPNIEEIDFDDNVQTIKTIFAYSNFKKVQLNKVFHISSYCFYGCKNLQSINLLSCSTIDEFAFCNSGLAGKIELGSVSIRRNSFSNTDIEEIVVNSLFYADNGDSLLNSETINAFSGCNKLKKLTIGYDYIDLSIFTGADSLNEINFDQIYDFWFEYPILYSKDKQILISCLPSCTTKELVIPESVRSIEYGFAYCKNIEKITFQSTSIRSFGRCCFKECINLKEIVCNSIISSVNSYCFENCSKLQNVDFLNKINLVGPSAFVGCSLIKRIDIPNVFSVPYGCFGNCVSLEEVILSPHFSHVKLDDKAFLNCSKLTSISFNDYLYEVPSQAFALSGLRSFTITNKILKIGSNAFFGCKDLVIIISDDHSTFYITETEVLLKKSNSLISLYGNNISLVRMSESVQGIDSESIESFATLNTKVLVIPPSIDNCLHTSTFFKYNTYDILLCKEGSGSIGFYGTPITMTARLSGFQPTKSYTYHKSRSVIFESYSYQLATSYSFYSSNVYNYAYEEFSTQIRNRDCFAAEENTTTENETYVNETIDNESDCFDSEIIINNNSLVDNNNLYKQSGKYKAELAFLIIFIMLTVAVISFIIYYQYLLHKLTSEYKSQNEKSNKEEKSNEKKKQKNHRQFRK